MKKVRRDADPKTADWRIIDLDEGHLTSYLVCLEDWSPEMQEAGDHKARWYDRARGEGLRVKLAVDCDDQAVGMIQYGPIELAPAQGVGAFMILCIWVHGHRAGVGKRQGHGIGAALLEAAEADARRLGATGLAAWGLRLPVWMKASWFTRHGYRRVDRRGISDLVWKPFMPSAAEPRWLHEQPVAIGPSGKVEVTAFKSGWCPAANLVYERAVQVADELGPDVHVSTVDTSDRATLLSCGHADAVFVNGRPLQRGAPPSLKAIRRKVGRELAKVRRRHAT